MKTLQRRLALAAASLLAACAGGPAPVAAPKPAGTPPAVVPAAIATAPDQVLKLAVAARGVQIYECRAAAGNRHEWAFVAPEAELLDAGGRTVGRHGAGPHWTFDGGTPQAATFPGRVTARVTGRADAPRAGAIPWLRLEAPATTPSAAPAEGGDLRSIQRINTSGGLAPADGCQPADAGRRVRVPYTADYLFYGER